jgi:hypothetical protein
MITDLYPVSKLPAAPLPDPYQVRVRSLLKPWHPLFEYNLITLDAESIVEFSVNFRDILCGTWLREHLKPVPVYGAFPGYLLASPEGCQQHLQNLSVLVFNCTKRLLNDSVAIIEAAERSDIQLMNRVGRIDPVNLIDWIYRVIKPLAPWITSYFSEQCSSGWLTLVGRTSPWIVRCGEGTKSEIPVRDFALSDIPFDAISQECRGIFNEHGAEMARAMLERYLLEHVVHNLYKMEFAV